MRLGWHGKEEMKMDRISRRQAVRGAGAAAAMMLGSPSVHAQNDRQTLRFVAQADLNGRPVVVLHVTDIPFLNAAAIVTRQRLESIGFKVILKAMDWSTNLVARTRKEPPDRGGWNLLHTWSTTSEVIHPAVHF